MTIAKSHFTAAMDAVFSDTGWRIDLAVSLPSGSWLRPDAAQAGGYITRLGNLDRAGVMALAPELWARSLRGGCGIHWRACLPAPLALLDDLDDRDAAALALRYRALVIETSFNSHQVLLLCDRPLDRLQQHRVQSELVQRLNAGGRRRADPGATGAGQFARMPGFGHPGHGGRLVRVVGRPWSGEKVLSVTDLLGPSGALPPAPQAGAGSTYAPALTASSASRSSPCSPRGPRVPRSGTRGKGAEAGNNRSFAGSESEIDFGIACNAIRNERAPESIIEEISTRAFSRGKRPTESECDAYAERTYAAALRAVRAINHVNYR